MALTFAYYLIQFLRFIFSAVIVILGFFVIFTKQFWLQKESYAMDEKLMWAALFAFCILALFSANKLVISIKNLRKNNIFCSQNSTAFKLAGAVATTYLIGKYVLLLYLHSQEQGKLAWHAWWNDSSTQVSEIVSIGLLACFFWVITQLIEEGIAYKNENDLTI